MTEHGHNFIREIAEAYRALEAEPAHIDRIKELEAKVDRHAQHAQNVELKLIDRHAEIEELKAKLRSVEAERDDAGFRLLEAEDRKTVTIHLVTAMRQEMNDLIVQLTGSEKTDMVFMRPDERREWEQYKADAEAKAKQWAEEAAKFVFLEAPTEPVAELPVEPAPQQSAPNYIGEAYAKIEDRPTDLNWTQQERRPGGQFGPKPTGPAEPVGGPPSAPPLPTVSPTHSGELEPGQSDSGPTVSLPPASQSETVTTAADTAAVPTTTTVEAIHGVYFGKRYYDHPVYVALAAWLEGGGTEADYHWRPDRATA